MCQTSKNISVNRLQRLYLGYQKINTGAAEFC